MSTGIIRSVKMIRSFPLEARNAYKSTKYPKWENLPKEHGGPAEAHAEWCKNCGIFHEVNYILGHKVSHKCLLIVVTAVESDGGREVVGEFDVDSIADMKELEAYDSYARNESWRGYYHKVAQGIQDYLNRFSPEKTRISQWLCDVHEKDETVWLAGVKEVGKTSYCPTVVIPYQVMELLKMQQSGVFMKFADVKSIDEFSKNELLKPGPINGDIHTFFFDAETALSNNELMGNYMKLGRKALEKLDDPANQRPRIHW